MKTDARPLISIDLLRFACALMVVRYHLAVAQWRDPSEQARRALAGIAGEPLPWMGAGSGWIGVELFFVISGYVIARSVDGRGAAAFLGRRWLRLAPAAWICGAATLAITVATIGYADPAGGVIRALLLWPMPPYIDASYWTLGIEASFYLSVAALVAGRREWNPAQCALLIGGVSAAYWLFAPMFGWSAAELVGRRSMQLLLLPHGGLFALGLWLADGSGRPAADRHWLVLIPAAGAAAAELTCHAAERMVALGTTSWVEPAGLALIGLAAIAAAERCQPALARLVPSRTARTLGLATYPLYLLHQDAGAVMIAAMMREGIGRDAAAAATVLLLLAASLLVATTVEPALRRGLQRGGRIAGTAAGRMRRAKPHTGIDVRPRAT